MLNKYLLVLSFSFFLWGSLSGQSEQIQIYNKYIHTSNEYVHGMLIVHRILENLNQEVNKFVDLQSSQFNFYGNKDLPKDIFMDPDGWFYEKSPTSLKAELSEVSNSFPPQKHKDLQNFIGEMSKLAARANSLRFELEAYINDNDLSIDENQIAVFKKLENCEYVYDRFFEVKESLHRYMDSILELKNASALAANENIDLSVFSRVQKKMKKVLDFWHFGIETNFNIGTFFSRSLNSRTPCKYSLEV